MDRCCCCCCFESAASCRAMRLFASGDGECLLQANTPAAWRRACSSCSRWSVSQSSASGPCAAAGVPAAARQQTEGRGQPHGPSTSCCCCCRCCDDQPSAACHRCARHCPRGVVVSEEETTVLLMRLITAPDAGTRGGPPSFCWKAILDCLRLRDDAWLDGRERKRKGKLWLLLERGSCVEGLVVCAEKELAFGVVGSLCPFDRQ